MEANKNDETEKEREMKGKRRRILEKMRENVGGRER